MFSRKQILKIAGLFSGVQGLAMLLNLVRAKLAALLLGPAGIGLNSIYNEMRELLHTSTNVGMDISGIRLVAAAYERNDSRETAEAVCITRSWVLLLALFGALLCLVLAAPLSWLTFGDFAHAGDFALLAPAVAFSSLTCGEAAVLKGLRQLKGLAVVSVLNVVVAIATTIPVYYLMGMRGIVPALVLMSAASYAVTACASFRIASPRFSLRRDGMKRGLPMLAVGFSFVLVGIVSHGAEFAVRSYLNGAGGLAVAGLYSAGFTIVMTYGGLAFASLETDYFPRLTGVFNDLAERRQTVLRQSEVLLCILAPLVAAIIIALPWIVPLLFSGEFSSVVPMARAAALGLIFRSVYLPFAYMPLSAGDSRWFFVLETVSYAVILGGVILGYNVAGLLGAGVALAGSNMIDMFVSVGFASRKYDVRPSRRMWLLLVAAVSMNVLAYSLTVTCWPS